MGHAGAEQLNLLDPRYLLLIAASWLELTH